MGMGGGHLAWDSLSCSCFDFSGNVVFCLHDDGNNSKH